MSLTSHQKLLVSVDAIGPVIFTSGFIFLRYFNRISHSLWLSYLFGIGLCCLWEIPFGIAGDDFLIEKFDNPLGFGVHILNAFWDSIIFLFGMYFIHIRNKNKICGLGQLTLLTIYGRPNILDYLLVLTLELFILLLNVKKHFIIDKKNLISYNDIILNIILFLIYNLFLMILGSNFYDYYFVVLKKLKYRFP